MNNFVNKQLLLQSINQEVEGMLVIKLLVREIAEAKGFNISSLARKADLGFSTVKRIWNDPQHDATISTLDKLSKALKQPIQDLIEQLPDPDEYW